MRSVVGSAAMHACAGHNHVRWRNLRAAISNAVQADRRVRSLNRLMRLSASDVARRLRRLSQLRDPYFHRWLELAAAVSGEPQHASAYLGARESIVAMTNAVETPILEQVATETGVRIAFRADPASVLTWYLADAELNEVIEPLLCEVIQRKRGLAESLTDSRLNSDDVDYRAFRASAFLEQLIRLDDDFVVVALAHYESLLDYVAIEPRSHSTLILHFAVATLAHFRRLVSPMEALRRADRFCELALQPITPARSPRLIRDLHFTRARVLENLSAESPEEVNHAVRAIKAGLAIAASAHERDARGRALGDLANLLRRLLSREADDAEIVATYEAALDCLPEGASFLPRGVVLCNFAVYMQERIPGDAAVNAERALHLADEAIAAIEEAICRGSPPIDTAGPLAGAYLIRGNAVRSRNYASPLERVKASIECYEEGIVAIGGQVHEVTAFLRFNLGCAYVGLHRLAGDVASLTAAALNFEEAEKYSPWIPLMGARARFERAMMALENDRVVPTELAKSLRVANEALEVIRSLGAARDVASATHRVGRLTLQSDAWEGALGCYKARAACAEACERYQALGDRRGAISSARYAALAGIQSLAHDPNTDALEEAAKILERATNIFEELWAEQISMGERTSLSILYGGVYSELLWCACRLGRLPGELWGISALSKSRELVQHLSVRSTPSDEGLETTSSELRESLTIKAHQTEVRFAASAAKVGAVDDLWMLAGPARAELESLDFEASLLDYGRPVAPPATIAQLLSDCTAECTELVVVDFSVSRWGTVVLLHSASKGSLSYVAPLSLPRLHEILWDPDHGFCSAYERLRRGEDDAGGSASFEVAVGTALRTLRNELFDKPLWDILSDTPGCRLLIAPGVLLGLPMHAVSDECSPRSRFLYEMVSGLSYIPSVSLLPRLAKTSARPARMACLLSAPEDATLSPLPGAPLEAVRAASRFSRIGTSVEFHASVGELRGAEALGGAAGMLPEDLEISSERPTATVLLHSLASASFVFYTGHGISDGLVLVDNDGRPKNFLTAELLVAPAMRSSPVVQLSACENAFDENLGVGESWSFVSTLLRRGAGFVVGGLWSVRESLAVHFSEAFQSSYLRGCPADVALCHAFGEARRHAEFHRHGITGWSVFAGFQGGSTCTEADQSSTIM